MIFENKPISEIRDQDLINLIGNREENVWVEFKQQDYHRDPTDPEKHKREICKDVTAMANASRGYIFIGIREENRVATEFCRIANAASVAQRIHDICLQHIQPRIPGMTVREYQMRWKQTDVDLVIIHIPTNERRPHGFTSRNTNNFVKRYNDTIREYPTSEMLNDYSQGAQTNPDESIRADLQRIETQLTPLLRHAGRNGNTQSNSLVKENWFFVFQSF